MRPRGLKQQLQHNNKMILLSAYHQEKFFLYWIKAGNPELGKKYPSWTSSKYGNQVLILPTCRTSHTCKINHLIVPVLITYSTETFPYGASSSPDDHYAVHIGAGQVIGCCSASHRTLILHQVSKCFAFFPYLYISYLFHQLSLQSMQSRCHM